jgi:hypothetical protein
MRKLSGLVLAGALLLSVSAVQAAEVTHIQANNLFANMVANDPDTGGSTGVFVTRQKGGGTVDTIFFIMTDPVSGAFVLGQGTLPKGAFRASAKHASLEVNVNEIALSFVIGEIPANAVISIEWDATSSVHTAGSTKQDFGNVQVNTTGNRTTTVSDVEGSVFGVPLADFATGDTSTIHETLHIHVTM